jgi:endonuclease/exonuclease/phosphatase family metal-dependent hydrolase
MAEDRLQLLSWNVRSLRDGRSAVARVLAAARVDVALMQEAPRWARWRSKRAALAREAGLIVGSADRIGGLCVLTTMRTWVVDHELLPLSVTPRLHRRALLTASVRVSDGPVWRLATTHLGLDGDERLRHAGEIRAALRSRAGVEVLTGDLNEEPGGQVWARLGEDLHDPLLTAGVGVLTFPARSPRRRIDAAWTGVDVEVLGAEVLDSPEIRAASDHLPLRLTLWRPRVQGRE